VKGGGKYSGGGLGPRAGVSYSGRSKAYAGSKTGRGKVSRGAIAKGDVDRGSKSRSHDRQALNHKKSWDHDDKKNWDHDHKKNWYGRRHYRYGYYAGDLFFYGGNYGGSCAWLRRQAVATGSPYWWSRYNACISVY
jgi:hypothetical protein